MQKQLAFCFLLCSLLSFSQSNYNTILQVSSTNQLPEPNPNFKSMLIRGEFLGSSYVAKSSVNNINSMHLNDSISKNRIAEIFKFYYYSVPRTNLKSTLKVHSNTQNGLIYLGLAGDLLDEYRLVDQTGNIILSQFGINKHYTTIDLSRLPSGTYFLQVMGNKEFSTKQIIKL